MPTSPDRRTPGTLQSVPGSSGAHRRPRGKDGLRHATRAAGAALGATALFLTGCSATPPDPAVTGVAPSASGTEGKAATPAPAATKSATAGPPAAADATAALRTKVTDVLGRLAAGTPKPSTAQVRDALTGAGVATGSLEVSESTTPTGLAADSIEAAVRQEKDCVIGQVREGAVTVTVLPVLASGKCFVGS